MLDFTQDCGQQNSGRKWISHVGFLWRSLASLTVSDLASNNSVGSRKQQQKTLQQARMFSPIRIVCVIPLSPSGEVFFYVAFTSGLPS